MIKRIHSLKTIILFGIIFTSCDPIVHEFNDIEDAVMYRANIIKDVSAQDTIKVMTWNIRFGVARLRFFGDGCGDRVIMTNSEVVEGLEGIAEKIKQENPDILFIQEADVQSKKTGYIDQAQWLLDHTDFNYGAYGSMWESQIILADGLGRVNTGNLILSKWKLENAERYQLPLRGDQDALTQFFYLRRNVIKAKVAMPGKSFFVVNTHLTAFATDDTKQKHIDGFKSILDGISAEGAYFIAGGDLNEIPPNASKMDYCLDDQCEGESFHSGGETEHKEGSYFEPEITWLSSLFNNYTPAIPLDVYGAHEMGHFTHSPDNKLQLDRKLDYLWTNTLWLNGMTHQEATNLSDHIPVSALWVIP
ncbi:MAG: endonuclease/exonuclease/phosphatase family protein [Candidatus Marinimicrobia bacterium]|nr:endonuclease/exonuclease/phosphatase family protein [Candidatus Neomarinimicrobiota bacterium]MBL7011044.1 endonuclease/exonuclease/phosphatase family protein [Candidatus Neomarinimicrobiota bacterium]MBL7031403.1 endonuclease/exonuclease/phosphatase family protein [Candidatus Neomarinimicrobiota bacterium]